MKFYCLIVKPTCWQGLVILCSWNLERTICSIANVPAVKRSVTNHPQHPVRKIQIAKWVHSCICDSSKNKNLSFYIRRCEIPCFAALYLFLPVLPAFCWEGKEEAEKYFLRFPLLSIYLHEHISLKLNSLLFLVTRKLVCFFFLKKKNNFSKL